MLQTETHSFFKKTASIYVLVFCILSKSVLIFFYTYTGRDKIYSLSASYNLLHGKGWTNSFYFLNNLDREILVPFCYWPPGYGLLISPFQAVFGTNLFLSTAIFEIVCFIAFIFLCRSVLKTQKISGTWLNISTVLLTFFSHDFIESSLGTDLPGLVFVLGFFYCSINIWNKINNCEVWRYGIIAGLCLFFASFIRYMYIPAGLFIIIVLLLLSYRKKNQLALKTYFIACIICLASLALVMLYLQTKCGNPFYTGRSENGIFPGNLKYWHPSVTAAFVDLNFASILIKKYTPIPLSALMSFLSRSTVLVYCLMTIAMVILLCKKKTVANAKFPFFSFAGFILCAAIIGELAMLSLTHAPQLDLYGKNAWTFIIEGRYHAFPVVFIQLSFLVVIARKKILPSAKIYSIILALLFVVFLLNSIHQFYYTAKVALHYKTMKAASVREQDYRYFERLLLQTIKENPGKDILVASSDEYYPLLASMHHQKGIADPHHLNDQVPIVRKPTILLTVVLAPEQKVYSNYLNKKGVNLVKEVARARMYMQLLEPSQ